MEISPIPLESFPHIWEAILAATPDAALPALRATCHDLRELIDERIGTHAVIVLHPRRMYTAVGRVSLPWAGNAALSARVRVLDMRKGTGGDSAGAPVALLGPEIAFPNVTVARIFDRESEQLLGRTIDRLAFSPRVPTLISQIATPKELNMDLFRYAAFGAVIADTLVLPVPHDLGLLDTHGLDLVPASGGEVVVLFDSRLDDAIRNNPFEPSGDGPYCCDSLARDLADVLANPDTRRATLVGVPEQVRAELLGHFANEVPEAVHYRLGNGDDVWESDEESDMDEYEDGGDDGRDEARYKHVQDKLRLVSLAEWRKDVDEDTFRFATEMPAQYQFTG